MALFNKPQTANTKSRTIGRKFPLFVVVFLGILVLALGFIYQSMENPPGQNSASRSVTASNERQSSGELSHLKSELAEKQNAAKPSSGETGNHMQTDPKMAVSPLNAYDLVAKLSHIDEESLTPDKVYEMNAILQTLSSQGAEALPAIHSLLASGENIDFLKYVNDPVGLEYDTLRLGLFDVLRKIEGSEAEGLLYDELQKTNDPVEVATLAQYLDEKAPGSYAEEAVQAARSVLGLAMKGDLEDQDVGPLFHVLQEYGDASLLADLQQSGDQWGHYATVALGGLSDGSGIPALINMVEARPEGNASRSVFDDNNLLAMQMLAQVAIDSPNAYETLLEQAGSNRIPDRLWPRIGSVLAGDDQLQLVEPDIDRQEETPYSWSTAKKYPYNTHRIGKDTLYSVHGSARLSQDEVDARVAVIDELLSVTENPAGVQALKRSRRLLTGS